MKRPYPGGVCLLLSLAARAQNDRIDTDRPSETVAVKTVEKGSFQAELGFRHEAQESEEIVWSHPRSLLRYGLFKKLEFRVELNPQTLQDKGSGAHQTGLAPVEPGIKAALCENRGALPGISLFAQVGIPKLSSAAFRPTYATPRLRALFENELNNQVRLTYNLGAEWTGDDTQPQWLYTFSPEIQVSKHWEAFAEVYGRLQKAHEPENTFDAGFAYYAGKNFKLDLSAGVGLTHNAPVNFVAVGFSIRTGQ